MISLVVLACALGAVSAHHNQYHYPAASYSYPYYQTPLQYHSFQYPQYTGYNSAPVTHYPYSTYTPVINTSVSAPVPPPAPAAFASRTLKPVAILRHNQDNNFEGTFSYDFESENGISNQASGYVKSISPEVQAQVMQGQYSYTAPDGTPIITRWYADETGFHAEGSHLPVAPPVPEAIAKSLAKQAA